MERGDEGAQQDDQKKRNGGIDTTSGKLGLVKEAVALFEERVHAGDSDHVNKISKARSEEDHVTCKVTLELELKETKQNLQRAIDEGMVMATCLSILQNELDQTKRELQQLKQKEQLFKYQSITGPAEEDWVEKDVKHVGDETKFEAKPELIMNLEKEPEFQKNHRALANVLERHPSLRTKKKKPLLGRIFSRRKGD
ncbi:hypothetical protein ACET3Z_024080 [Daucus carota]